MTSINDDIDDINDDYIRRLVNRQKQAKFRENMAKQGYKRRNVWLSKESQQLLDSLAAYYTKEELINEALELLALVRGYYPDTMFCDP